MALQREQEVTAKYKLLLESGAYSSDMPPAGIQLPQSLSKREKEVVQLLLAGKSRMEISASLDISLHTVNTYCARIYKKMDVSGLGGLLEFLKIPLDK